MSEQPPNPNNTPAGPKPVLVNEYGHNPAAFTWDTLQDKLARPSVELDTHTTELIHRLGGMLVEETFKKGGKDKLRNRLVFKDADEQERRVHVPKGVAEQIRAFGSADSLDDDAPKPPLTDKNEYDMTTLGSPDGGSNFDLGMTDEQQENMLNLGVTPEPEAPAEPQPKMVWGYRGPRKRMNDAQLKQLWGSDFNKYKKTPKPVEAPTLEPIAPSPIHPESRTPLTTREEILKYYPDFYETEAEEAAKEPAATAETKPDTKRPHFAPLLSAEDLEELRYGKKPEAVKAPEAEPEAKDRQALLEEYKRERSSKNEPSKEGVLATESDVKAKEVKKSVLEIIPVLDSNDLERMRDTLSLDFPELAELVTKEINNRNGTIPEVDKKERVRRLAKIGKKVTALVLPFKPVSEPRKSPNMPADEQLFEAA